MEGGYEGRAESKEGTAIRCEKFTNLLILRLQIIHFFVISPYYLHL